jgi:hypothetical protein
MRKMTKNLKRNPKSSAVLASAALVLLTAVSGYAAPPQPAPEPVPEWFSKRPKAPDNSNYFYIAEVGTGADVNEAKENAWQTVLINAERSGAFTAGIPEREVECHAVLNVTYSLYKVYVLFRVQRDYGPSDVHTQGKDVDCIDSKFEAEKMRYHADIERRDREFRKRERDKENKEAGTKAKVAVFVTGDRKPDCCRYNFFDELKGRLEIALKESGKYGVVLRSKETDSLAELERKYKRPGGNVIPDEEAGEGLERFGVGKLCIARLSHRGGSAWNVNMSLTDVWITKEEAGPVEWREDVRSGTNCYRFADRAGRVLVGGEETAIWLRDSIKASDGKRRLRSISAVGLEIAGLGVIGYGIYKDRKMIHRANAGGVEKKEIDELKSQRTAGYIVGSALLAAGITIHIPILFFNKE